MPPLYSQHPPPLLVLKKKLPPFVHLGFFCKTRRLLVTSLPFGFPARFIFLLLTV